MKQFKLDRTSYINLYKAKLGSPYLLDIRKNPVEMKKLQDLEKKLDLETILLFRKCAEKELEYDKQQYRKEQQQKQESKKSFLRFFKKKSKSTDSIPTEESTSTDQLLLDVYKEFDINIEENSSLNSTSPQDIQCSFFLQLDCIQLTLKDKSIHYFDFAMNQFKTLICKRNGFFEMDATLLSFQLLENSQSKSTWSTILYTNDSMLTEDLQEVQTIVPALLWNQSSTIPYLQVHLEFPALDHQSDVKVRLYTLPIYFNWNLKFIIQLIDFFIPTVSNLNLYAYQDQALRILQQVTSRRAAVYL